MSVGCEKWKFNVLGLLLPFEMLYSIKWLKTNEENYRYTKSFHFLSLNSTEIINYVKRKRNSPITKIKSDRIAFFLFSKFITINWGRKFLIFKWKIGRQQMVLKYLPFKREVKIYNWVPSEKISQKKTKITTEGSIL